MSDVKLVAFHLPQYHEIPENDEWWGKGFTEWTNVKKGVPLYPGHNQPRVPMNQDYYNLHQESVLQRQMDQAKEYGLYGFCFYHYWFDGKLLLEKPVEMLLHMKRKINYCLCWANEPWSRAWEGKEQQVIMPQRYGGQPEWEQHFQYLLPFFQDSFYMKQEGKPMLVLYRANNITDCEAMIAYWDRRCKECGFPGIYIIEEKNSFQNEKFCKNSAACLEFEPMYTITYGRNYWEKGLEKLRSKICGLLHGHSLHLFSYSRLWKRMAARRHDEKAGYPTYLGGFADWDNSARKGKYATVAIGASSARFKEGLKQQIEHARKEKCEYIFLNAWNEWAEGTYLEPDEKNGYAYLEAIKELMG